MDTVWWGTGAAATQCEGAAPRADWAGWEAEGRAPASRDGNGFRTRYADDFALLAAHGLTHHRLTIEWARLEPVPGRWDADEVDHVRRVLDAGGRGGRRGVGVPAARLGARVVHRRPAGLARRQGRHAHLAPPRRPGGRGVRRPGGRMGPGPRARPAPPGSATSTARSRPAATATTTTTTPAPRCGRPRPRRPACCARDASRWRSRGGPGEPIDHDDLVVVAAPFDGLEDPLARAGRRRVPRRRRWWSPATPTRSGGDGRRRERLGRAVRLVAERPGGDGAAGRRRVPPAGGRRLRMAPGIRGAARPVRPGPRPPRRPGGPAGRRRHHLGSPACHRRWPGRCGGRSSRTTG